jgi:hypothetical protein
MSLIVAPAELPFAPRPYSDELLSSWLLQVAAANLVSLHELLDGFEDHYGPVLINVRIDYAISNAAITALAKFCRVAPEKIHALDIRLRAAHLSPALLLRYPQSPALFWCLRCSLRRVRYAFSLCLAKQPRIHVRWDWSVACLIRCAFHRTPLLNGCPACGEPDPLPSPGFDSPSIPVCRSCGRDLTASQNNALDVQSKGNVQAVEDAYRAMLLGIAPEPALLGKATDRAFRQFVEDMLQLLTRSLNPDSQRPTTSNVQFSRHDIVQIITALVENAAPSSERRVRSRRYSRGLILWATLLKLLPELEGSSLEQRSVRWPVSLRRRFVSGLYFRTKKRWPYSPYGPRSGKRIDRREMAAIYGLRPAPTARFKTSLPARSACNLSVTDLLQTSRISSTIPVQSLSICPRFQCRKSMVHAKIYVSSAARQTPAPESTPPPPSTLAPESTSGPESTVAPEISIQLLNTGQCHSQRAQRGKSLCLGRGKQNLLRSLRSLRMTGFNIPATTKDRRRGTPRRRPVQVTMCCFCPKELEKGVLKRKGLPSAGSGSFFALTRRAGTVANLSHLSALGVMPAQGHKPFPRTLRTRVSRPGSLPNCPNKPVNLLKTYDRIRLNPAKSVNILKTSDLNRIPLSN